MGTLAPGPTRKVFPVLRIGGKETKLARVAIRRTNTTFVVCDAIEWLHLRGKDNEWERGASLFGRRPYPKSRSKGDHMKTKWIWAAGSVAFLLACGASFPVPTQRMADAES